MSYRKLERDRCSMLAAATTTAAALLTVLALLPAATIADGSSQLGMCRMDPTAAHQFCGLPQELSNFQGGPSRAAAGTCTGSASLALGSPQVLL